MGANIIKFIIHRKEQRERAYMIQQNCILEKNYITAKFS